MQEEDFITFKAIIAGTVFPMTIKRSEEQEARRLLKEINDKINHYRTNYKNRELSDWLTMTLLNYAFEVNSLQKGVISESVQHKLNQLEQKLSHLVG